MPKMKRIKVFDPIAVPNTIVKIKPSFYGTKPDYHDPECKVAVKIDVWVVRKALPKQHRFQNKVVATDYIQSVEVDFENRKLMKNGEEITAQNTGAVFEVLEEMLRG